MNSPDNTLTNTASTPQAPGPDDPRYAFALVADAVGNLIESTTPAMVSNATPCPEFTVKELLEHMVLAVNRVAAIGRGEHWSTIDTVQTNDGWAADYRAGTHAIMLAWSDPALLETMLEAPWAECPGAAVIYMYTAELAVHAWDLATATGLAFTLDDDLLHGALVAAKFAPAEGRDDPDMPFAPVVDPGLEAPMLDQLAGWLGRPVL